MSMDLETIKTREQAATPGPWKPAPLDEKGFRYVDGVPEYHQSWWVSQAMQLGNGECGSMIQADAEFIAHARQDIPALIAEVERLRGMLAYMEKQVEHLEDIIIANDR